MQKSEIDATTEKFLYMNWLRPETIPWAVHGALLSRDHLRVAGNKLEIGIGNGLTSFQHLGGRFAPEYDWYYNVDTEGFWRNQDIYDQVSLSNIRDFIQKYPTHRLKMAVDNKQNLLDQARQLEIAEDYVLADANGPITFPDMDLVFSNMLYWLADPMATMRKICETLKPGGTLVTMFPNPRFVEYCRSYRRETPMWTMINRGRADTLMWTLEADAFEEFIARETDFAIVEGRLYLARLTLGIWDIGLRPLSPYLIRMANGLDPETRFAIKRDWCEETRPIVAEVVAQELEKGPLEGGFNFFVLRKA